MGHHLSSGVAGETGFLTVDQPLDLEATLKSGQAFRWREYKEWHWGVIGQHAFALRQTEGRLLFRSSAPSTDEARTALQSYFRLDDNLESIYKGMSTDRRLKEAISKHNGLRLLRQDPWECLVSFVCSSASNIRRIGRTVQAMAEAYGEPLGLDGQRLYSFPQPQQLAKAGERALRALSLGFRAKYVAQIAPLAADGRLDFGALRHVSYFEAKAELMNLPGIGEKVADCVLLFSLDRLEAFPVDRWVRRLLEEWYGHREKARYSDLCSWAQNRWGLHAGYAQQYLYHHRRLMG